VANGDGMRPDDLTRAHAFYTRRFNRFYCALAAVILPLLRDASAKRS
jgi:hypothetical protein